MNGIYNERYVEETPLVYKLDLNHDMALDTSAQLLMWTTQRSLEEEITHLTMVVSTGSRLMMMMYRVQTMGDMRPAQRRQTAASCGLRYEGTGRLFLGQNYQRRSPRRHPGTVIEETERWRWTTPFGDGIYAFRKRSRRHLTDVGG
ncbi:hypothetical protein M8J75_006619 [Diaphorina citri]|nr:hypothetical protein M8J75_006619 [Diaphorina citri]